MKIWPPNLTYTLDLTDSTMILILVFITRVLRNFTSLVPSPFLNSYLPVSNLLQPTSPFTRICDPSTRTTLRTCYEHPLTDSAVTLP